jgi:transcriptional antiterminator RfaH
MPVLAPEPVLFPDCLFDNRSPEHSVRRWWVLHTRPRQEKCLARQLYNLQVPFYLPLIARRWRSRGQMLTSHVPLYDGYVFLLADRDQRITALTTHRVVRSLEVSDQEQMWRDLGQTNRLIASGAPVTPEDRLAPGEMVEIRSGPLAGLQGRILRTASGRRFIVQVDFIQRGASVLLDDYTLTRIRDESGC